MGHYLSEMGSGETEEARNRRLRKKALEEALGDVPLGEFTVNELRSVMRLKGLARNSVNEECLHDEDYEILERKAEQLQRRRPAKPRRSPKKKS